MIYTIIHFSNIDKNAVWASNTRHDHFDTIRLTDEGTVECYEGDRCVKTILN